MKIDRLDPEDLNEKCLSCAVVRECDYTDLFFEGNCPCMKCIVKPICRSSCNEWHDVT